MMFLSSECIQPVDASVIICSDKHITVRKLHHGTDHTVNLTKNPFRHIRVSFLNDLKNALRSAGKQTVCGCFQKRVHHLFPLSVCKRNPYA